MLRYEYTNLTKLIGKNFNCEDPSPATHAQPNTGQHRGKAGIIVKNWRGKLTIRIEDDTIILPYKDVDLIDDFGDRIVSEVLDSTGRPITLGTVLAYAMLSGDKIGLEIGQVTGFSPAGYVTTKPMIRNGSLLGNNTVHWSKRERKRANIDPKRSICLPVDNQMVVMWLLSDFVNFKADTM